MITPEVDYPTYVEALTDSRSTGAQSTVYGIKPRTRVFDVIEVTVPPEAVNNSYGSIYEYFSQAFYGTPTFWSIIMEANPLVHPCDIKVGDTLKVPSSPYQMTIGVW